MLLLPTIFIKLNDLSFSNMFEPQFLRLKSEKKYIPHMWEKFNEIVCLQCPIQCLAIVDDPNSLVPISLTFFHDLMFVSQTPSTIPAYSKLSHSKNSSLAINDPMEFL